MAKQKENSSLTENKEVNLLVEKAVKSLEAFRKLDQTQVDNIVAKASVAALEKHGVLALHAVEETGRGVFEDKATKNLFACEYIINHLRNVKTVGVINEDPVAGITEIADPVGVVCAMTPTTNPTSTTIFKALICLKTRNPIIFAFHPSAQESSAHAAKIVYEAAVAAGAPKDCVQWITKPSLEATGALMNHSDVATILATGGNAMVKAAYSCGKPALGVGAGNVPAYVEKSANLRQAVNDIIMSKAFDNGMICASEQAAIVDKEIYNDFIKEMKSYGVYFANDKEKTKLEEFIFGVKANSKNCAMAKLNADVVGKSAFWIAKQAGFKVPERTNIIVAECSEVGPKEPLTREKLSPVLALLKSKSTKEGISLSEQMVEFHGLGHSAAIHTADAEIAKQFGVAVKAARIIWNAPSTFGGIGDVYNSFIPSLTLGCGSYGKNSVSGNVGAINLINIKRVGRRNNNMQWFKVPPKIYFEKNSIAYLREMSGVERVLIVTDQGMVNLGFVNRLIDQLNARSNNVTVQTFAEVEPNPSIQTVQKGVSICNQFKPDTIIALGGGSPMDAGKVIWMMYEQPKIDFKDLVQKFMDIRKRAIKFPPLGEKAKFVGVATTSGTGAEVTPFAVISDGDKKYPIADYALTPHVAIVDPELVMTVPAFIAADTGMDALTHATESYISIMASDFTEGLSLTAVKLIFENLEASVKKGKDAPEAREKMHNAATVAGMAFANAFLGIVHSLSHKIGGRFHIPHGRTNAILLPHVIRYNGTKPEKFSTWPKYDYYRADEKLQDLAKLLGLPAKTPEEGVESYAKAVTKLAKSVGIKMSFKEQGIDEKEFFDECRNLALLAFEDQCSPANPRLPMIEDMMEIMRKAYYGIGV